MKRIASYLAAAAIFLAAAFYFLNRPLSPETKVSEVKAAVKTQAKMPAPAIKAEPAEAPKEEMVVVKGKLPVTLTSK